MDIFWVITPCNLVCGIQLLHGICYFCHQGRSRTTRFYKREDHVLFHNLFRNPKYFAVSLCCKGKGSEWFLSPSVKLRTHLSAVHCTMHRKTVKEYLRLRDFQMFNLLKFYTHFLGNHKLYTYESRLASIDSSKTKFLLNYV